MSFRTFNLKKTLKSYIAEINYLGNDQIAASGLKSPYRVSTKLFLKIVQRIFQKMFFLDQWYLMYDLNHSLSMDLETYKPIIPPKDRFWADPNIIQKDGKFFVFFEELYFKQNKGHISFLILDQNGVVEGPVKILEEEYHLSYPFVFHWDGNYYMVPETAENRGISLYECVDFPDKWVFRSKLMENVLAVDSTLFHHHDKWWLFTGMPATEDDYPFVQLFLFYSNDLFSNQWIPHPMNPIVTDVNNARPAGNLFIQNGKIFRPSQTSGQMYGHGVNINEIIELSEVEYQEKLLNSIKPEKGDKAERVHTISREGQATVIDAFMRRRKF